MSESETRTRSNWWYLLPILFSIFGGLISYFAIRHDDPKKARNCLIVGIILFVIPLIIPAIMIGTLSQVEMHDDDFFFEMRREFIKEFGSDFPIVLPGSDFEVSYTKEGGIAGIRQAITIDSDKMIITDGVEQMTLSPPSHEELGRLKDAIEKSNFFRIVTTEYPPTKGSADYFSYSLRITSEGRGAYMTWTDTSVDVPDVGLITKELESIWNKYRYPEV